jgi:cyclohexadienyl dehydratase
MSLAQSLGAKLDIVKTTWSTLKSDLEANGLDITMGKITITLDRQKAGCSPTRLFKRQDADHALRRRAEIRDDRGDRSAGRAGDRQSRRNHRAPRSGSLQKISAIIQWSDNTTIFDALIEGKRIS